MGAHWFEALRRVCKAACVEAGSTRSTEVVLFYLARWSQKKAGTAEPEIVGFDQATLSETAARIARNLTEDGERVERLVHGDAEELSRLRRLLVASARPRAGEAAPDFADEALQRVAIVLLMSTPPSRAAAELRKGPAGPRNEYVFQAPFEPWARRVVINLVIDERRREARRRAGPAAPRRGAESPPLESSILKRAHDALPDLVAAIRALPSAQRSAMALSLARPDVDELVRERLHELDPALFSAVGGDEGLCSSDEEIAEQLGSTARRVAANRSLARRRLAERDSHWELLLDQLLPHRSTRPIDRGRALAGAPESNPNRDD